MTIREIEALSGMTRANIRFYESEGLLTPNRMENGYRDYTRSDLDTLHKIRLLRALGLGIDEIRKLAAGETALDEALESRLSAMQTEQRRSHERCCRRTRTMRHSTPDAISRRWKLARRRLCSRTCSRSCMYPGGGFSRG